MSTSQSGGLFMQSNIYIKRDKDGKEEKHSLNIGGLNGFWHLQEIENGYILTCEDYRKEFASLDEVNKYFINLEEFLKSSKYVGRQFQRTMPLKDDDDCLDYSYTKANRYSIYLALYEKDGIFIAYRLNELFDYHDYVVIPKHYTEDKNYELSDLKTLISFPNALYDKIVVQESKPKNKELTLKRD